MTATLAIRPWPDPVIDTLGHDPRSLYVERFWLPTLGPTSLLLLRRIAAGLDEHPEGISLDLGELSQALGLGHREGNSSPVVRSLDRLMQFDLACGEREAGYAVRRSVPPVNRRHVGRLPGAAPGRAPRAGRNARSPSRRSPSPVVAPGGSRSRCSSRATTSITSSASSTTSASTRRSAGRARRGPTTATSTRSTKRSRPGSTRPPRSG